MEQPPAELPSEVWHSILTRCNVNVIATVFFYEKCKVVERRHEEAEELGSPMFVLAKKALKCLPIVLTGPRAHPLQADWAIASAPGSPQKHFALEIHLGDRRSKDADAMQILQHLAGLGHSLDLKLMLFATRLPEEPPKDSSNGNNGNSGGNSRNNPDRPADKFWAPEDAFLTAATITELCRLPHLKSVCFSAVALSLQSADLLETLAPTVGWNKFEYINRTSAINAIGVEFRLAKAVSKMPQLETLHWEYNRSIKLLLIQKLFENAKVRELSLSGCIADQNALVIPANVPAAATLEVLDLSNMRLTSLKVLSPFPRLVRWFMAGNADLDAASRDVLRNYGAIVKDL